MAISEGNDVQIRMSNYFSKEQEVFYAKQRNIERSIHEVSIPRRWQTSCFLGRGSFGTVMQAIDEDTGDVFAVKEVKLLGKEKTPERIAELELEVRILSQLRHPHIVGYLGSRKTEHFLYIFMEYTGQHSLRSILKNGALSEAQIREYSIQILRGLEYLHSHGVLYRDLKGANVLVTDDGVCKLADFGCAKQKTDLEDTSEFLSFKGTVNWMAPEIMQRTGHGRHADIWSFGCVVTEMATGQAPWAECKMPFNVFNKVCYTDETPDLSMLSPLAQHFAKQCFNRTPSKRPNVCDLLHHPFIVSSERQSSRTTSGDSKQASGLLTMGAKRLSLEESLDEAS